MGSKSVLVLGVVFIFLLNVVAVHNYINEHYYQPAGAGHKKDMSFSLDSFKRIYNDFLVESQKMYPTRK